MPTIYFIADFAYNPESKTPLKIFELGDAFCSGYPEKKFGMENQTVSTRFYNYLQKQYPNALFFQAFLGGLNMMDFTDLSQYNTYDKNKVFDDSVSAYSPSFNTISNLLKNINITRGKRSKNSRRLLLHVSDPLVRFHSPRLDLESDEKLEFLNTSETVLEALNNKKTFHKFAESSDIYPKTICLNIKNDDFLEHINSFLDKAKEAEYFVIKPIQGTRSEGVHILPRLKLLESIQQIRSKQLFLEDYYRYQDGMVIQSCHLSKYFSHKGDMYLAKGRVFLRADFKGNDEKMPELSLITGYWQLAKTPCSKITDETTIANGPANPDGVLVIDNDDWEKISELLLAHLPQIIKKMLINDNQTIKSGAFNLRNKAEKIEFSRENYAWTLNNFFNQQLILPAGPLRQVYYRWNNYISDRQNKMLVKETIIDLVGIDQQYKSTVLYNNQPLEPFIRDTVSILFGDTAKVLSPEASFSNKIIYECRSAQYALLIGFGISFLCTRSLSVESILLGLYFSLAVYLMKNLTRYQSNFHQVRSYFFQEAKPGRERSLDNKEEDLQIVIPAIKSEAYRSPTTR